MILVSSMIGNVMQCLSLVLSGALGLDLPKHPKPQLPAMDQPFTSPPGGCSNAEDLLQI